jgi:hypothetical protein
MRLNINASIEAVFSTMPYEVDFAESEFFGFY